MRRRVVASGEKTAEDQGVPWMKTMVCCGLGGDDRVVGDERRAYLMFQLSWWKVDGRGIGVGVVIREADMVFQDNFLSLLYLGERAGSMSVLFRFIELVFVFAMKPNYNGLGD